MILGCNYIQSHDPLIVLYGSDRHECIDKKNRQGCVAFKRGDIAYADIRIITRNSYAAAGLQLRLYIVLALIQERLDGGDRFRYVG